MEIKFTDTDQQRRQKGVAVAATVKKSVFAAKKEGVSQSKSEIMQSLVNNRGSYQKNAILAQSKILAQDSEAYEYDTVYDEKVLQKREDFQVKISQRNDMT